MNKILILSFILIVNSLTGCQSIRPYDGVLGYQVVSINQDKIEVTYTVEESMNWEKILRKTENVCKKRLETSINKFSFQELSRNSFSQNVDMSIRIPTGTFSTGDMVGLKESKTSISFDEKIIRPILLRRVNVLCSK